MTLNTVFAGQLAKDFDDKWKALAPSSVAEKAGVPCEVDANTEAYIKNLAWAIYLDGVTKGLDLGDNLARTILEKLG